MEKKSISFIGGGRITRIFLQAFQNKNKIFKEIIVYDLNPDILKRLKNKYEYIQIETDNIEKAAKCDIIFLALHPPVIKETLTKISEFISYDSILVSLAPKITISKIQETLNGFKRIARVNPSATGIINEGINPIAFSETMDPKDREYLVSVLQILGKTQVVEESKIEAYAIISAMGPTYFWFQIEQLKLLGISYGMDNKEAEETITGMINGAANTLFKSKLTPEEVMDLVAVKPLGEYEETITKFYIEKLNAIYNKIKSE